MKGFFEYVNEAFFRKAPSLQEHPTCDKNWLFNDGGVLTLINQNGSKVYNGICSKMLAGSGKKVQVTQKGSQSNQGWSTMIGVPFYIFDAAALEA